MKLKSYFVTPKILYFTWNFRLNKTGNNEKLKLIKAPCKTPLWN